MTNASLPLVLLSLTGCFVTYDDGPDRAPVNSAPFVTYADAGCGWDSGYRDYVWWFEADADDYDGPGDVVAVYADVYDTWNGTWVDGFELYPEQGINWYSAWVGSSTYLECGYPDYVVDITAVDMFEEVDVVTVYPTF